MLAHAGLVRCGAADIAAMAASGKPLIEAFLSRYIQAVAQEWQRGPIRRYVVKTEERMALRGRLEIVAQLRRTGVRRPAFITSADEFDVDNPVSQVLKAAVDICAAQALDDDTARRAKGLRGEFSEVSTRDVATGWWEKVQVDRTLARFDPALELAKHIIRMASPDRAGSAPPTFVMMFDMNEIFEAFVAAQLRAALVGSGLRMKAQVQGKSLLERVTRDGRRDKDVFRLRPDIGVYDGDKLVCVLDTKWVRLDEEKALRGISQDDMYQMYAYGKEYAVADTVVIYPRVGGLGRVVDVFRHRSDSREGGSRRRIHISTVDIRPSLAAPEAVRSFRADLRALCQGGEALP